MRELILNSNDNHMENQNIDLNLFPQGFSFKDIKNKINFLKNKQLKRYYINSDIKLINDVLMINDNISFQLKDIHYIKTDDFPYSDNYIDVFVRRKDDNPSFLYCGTIDKTEENENKLYEVSMEIFGKTRIERLKFKLEEYQSKIIDIQKEISETEAIYKIPKNNEQNA